MKTKMRIVKTGFEILLLMVVVVSLAHQGSATPEYISELQKVYGSGSCTVCHFNSHNSDSGDLTVYGDKFAAQSSHFKDPVSALRIIGEPPVKVPIKMSEYVLVLQGVYGNGSCTICHVNNNGVDELTVYGKKFVTQPNYSDDPIAAIRAIGVPDEIVNTEKSPGFEIVATIGIVSVIYMLRRSQLPRGRLVSNDRGNK